MSAVAVVGAKLSNNQHKVDQAWDWLKRIWIAWMIINGIGAFIAYVTPLSAVWQLLHPKNQIANQRSVCDLERRSSEMSALGLLKKV